MFSTQVSPFHNSAEAVYAIRTRMIEAAKNFWPRIKELNTNQVLQHTNGKSKILEAVFEEHLIKDLGYNLGEQVSELNHHILFKTFLEENDPRLVDPNAKKAEESTWLGWSMA